MLESFKTRMARGSALFVLGLAAASGTARATDYGYYNGYTWSTDRSDPQVWEVLPTYEGMTDVLHIQTFPSTTVPSSALFYQYEGAYALTNLSSSGSSSIAGKVYIPSSFESSDGVNFTNLGLWGVVGQAPSSATSYPVISFYNGPASDPGGKETVQVDSPTDNVGEVRVFDGYKWVVVTGPNAVTGPGLSSATINYDGWNDIRIEYIKGDTPEESQSVIRLNGVAIATLSCDNSSLACEDFEYGSPDDNLYQIIINTWANGTSSEDIYWADVYAALLAPPGGTQTFTPGETLGNVDVDPEGTTTGGTVENPVEITGNVNNFGGTFGGNADIDGDFYNAGTVSPGNSPGIINIGGDYNAAPGATFDMQVDLSAAAPLAGTDYDQVNVVGSVTGTTSIFLFDPSVGSPTTPLSSSGSVGDISAIQLVTIGGSGDLSNFTLGQRYVRNGMDVVLTQLSGAIGLSLTLADESYVLASVPALSLRAADALYGTYVDRRGLDWDMNRFMWAHGVATSQTIDTDLSSTKTELYGGQFGIDLFALGSPSTRFGVTAGYSSQSGTIHSGSGAAAGTLSGTAPGIGAYITHQGDVFYADLSGQYRALDFDLSSPLTSTMKVSGHQLDLTAEAGAKLGSGSAMLVPFVQLVYLRDFLNRSTTGVFDATFSSSDALIARARLLAQFKTGALTAYGSAGVSGDLLGSKTTTVSGTSLNSDLGGPTAEFSVGLDGMLAPNFNVFGSFQYAVSFDGKSHGYAGRVGFRNAF